MPKGFPDNRATSHVLRRRKVHPLCISTCCACAGSIMILPLLPVVNINNIIISIIIVDLGLPFSLPCRIKSYKVLRKRIAWAFGLREGASTCGISKAGFQLSGKWLESIVATANDSPWPLPRPSFSPPPELIQLERSTSQQHLLALFCPFPASTRVKHAGPPSQAGLRQPPLTSTFRLAANAANYVQRKMDM